METRTMRIFSYTRISFGDAPSLGIVNLGFDLASWDRSFENRQKKRMNVSAFLIGLIQLFSMHSANQKTCYKHFSHFYQGTFNVREWVNMNNIT